MISIVLPDLRGGGVERIRLVLAREFARRGYSVEFVLMQARGGLLPEAEAAFAVADLRVRRLRQVPRALGEYLRRRRPHAMLVAMWPLTALAPAARIFSGHRCRTVVSEHNTLSVQYGSRGMLHGLGLRATMAAGYRLADARVGVSAGVVRDMARLSMMSEREFQVIYNPAPPRDAPSPRDLERVEGSWGVPRGRRILAVGSFKKQKNHPLLLRSFARLSEEGSARLMLLGAGEEERSLRLIAAELRVSDKVIFSGFHPDPTPFYRTADLFVLSSDYEGFGNVIVEALACGVPVVSTDCPSGPAEILENGRYGSLVPCNDAEALAAAMRKALDGRHDRAALQERAAAFSPEKAADAYLSLLFGQDCR